MKIQILIENTCFADGIYMQSNRRSEQSKIIDDRSESMNNQPKLVCEHGLSMLIEYNDRKILLDAGSTSEFMNNAEKMGVDIEADLCVLSHGHYDHSGGFAEYLRQYPDKKVYAMKHIVNDYYSGSGGSIHPIGVPKEVYPTYKDNFVLLEGSTQLDDGIYIVAHNNTDNKNNINYKYNNTDDNVNNTNSYAKIGERGKLYKKLDDEYVPDDFRHELSLVFDTENGLVIFNSCSHIGIINIIDEIKEYFGKDKKIRAFVGGLHMKGTSKDREICTFSEKEIEEMVKCLDENHIEKLYTGHCTGVVGYELIKKYMGESVEYISTGKEIDLK